MKNKITKKRGGEKINVVGRKINGMGRKSKKGWGKKSKKEWGKRALYKGSPQAKKNFICGANLINRGSEILKNDYDIFIIHSITRVKIICKVQFTET